MENLNTIEFNKIKFVNAPTIRGIRAVVKFDNGYSASIVKGFGTYGSKDGLYEMAMLDNNGKIVYGLDISDDVLGYLSESDVSLYLLKISKLPKI